MKHIKINRDSLRLIDKMNPLYATKDIIGYIVLDGCMRKMHTYGTMFYVGETYCADDMHKDVNDMQTEYIIGMAKPPYPYAMEYLTRKHRWNTLMELYHSNERADIAPITKYDLFTSMVVGGITLFPTINDAIRERNLFLNSNELGIFKVIIPKGSWYFNGEVYHSDIRCLMSEKIKVIERMDI